MARLVVDSSVVIKWFLSEPFSAESLRILDGYQLGSVILLAPDLLYAEIGNIIWKKQIFQGLSPADAKQILLVFGKLRFVHTPIPELLDDAYRIAVDHKCSVYDALYVALSVREQCPLVTADEKLLNAVHSSFPDVTLIADWV